jgi:hypothetical protein
MSFEVELRIRDGRIWAGVPGTEWHEELANNFLLAPSRKKAPGGEPNVIYGVGEYAAAGREEVARSVAKGLPIPAGLAAAMEAAIDVQPFPDGPLKPGVTASALSYFVHRGWKGTTHSRRDTLEHWSSGKTRFCLDYPGWWAVPPQDREELLRMLARFSYISEFWVNGRLLLKRRPFRPAWRVADP